MTKLPRKVEGDSLGARHVNQLSEAAEKFMSMQRTNNAGLAPFVQQQCVVVAIGCNGVDDTGTADDSDSDPTQVDLYTIRVYFWDSISNAWVLDDQGEGYCLDDKLVRTGYTVGSKLIAYFDPQRNAYIPISSGGPSETQIINFQIVSSDPTTRSALVQIEQRAFRGKVYGSILNDEVVYVYDTRGCYLNKRNEDLTGRFGEAVLMYTDDAAAELHFSNQYEPPERYWCVQDLCCPNIVCED